MESVGSGTYSCCQGSSCAQGHFKPGPVKGSVCTMPDGHTTGYVRDVSPDTYSCCQ